MAEKWFQKVSPLLTRQGIFLTWCRVISLFRIWQVPVLVIAASRVELTKLVAALSASSVIPSEEVQRFSEFDAEGKSLKTEWMTLIGNLLWTSSVDISD